MQKSCKEFTHFIIIGILGKKSDRMKSICWDSEKILEETFWDYYERMLEIIPRWSLGGILKGFLAEIFGLTISKKKPSFRNSWIPGITLSEDFLEEFLEEFLEKRFKEFLRDFFFEKKKLQSVPKNHVENFK